MPHESNIAVQRLAARHLIRVGRRVVSSTRRVKTAGEVRFIKDRGGDHGEWAWNAPGSSERDIDPKYEFNPKHLKPLAKALRAALMGLGHAQSAYAIFTKIKSRQVSPDGNLGGKGYVMPVKDIRKQLMNCSEALSAVTDTMYDEINATHWHPDVHDSGGDPRDRGEVKQIMDDVEEIKDDPEDWAEEEEADMDDSPTPGKTAKAAGIQHKGKFAVRALGSAGQAIAAQIARSWREAQQLAAELSMTPRAVRAVIFDHNGMAMTAYSRGRPMAAAQRVAAAVRRQNAIYAARRLAARYVAQRDAA